MKKNKRISLFLIIGFFAFYVSVANVSAATGTLSGVGSNGTVDVCGHKTYYNKKINGDTVYCLQVRNNTGANGAKYTTINSYGDRYSDNAYIGGQIIKIARSKYSGKDEYRIITNALNYYYKLNNSVSCHDSKVDSLISTAKSYVNKYKKSKSLPKITIKTSGGTLEYNPDSKIYTSGKITISGLENTKYGSVGTKNTTSTVPKYTLKVTSSSGNVKLCKDNAGSNCLSGSISENGEYYIVLSGSDSSNGKVTININGSNSSKYPSGIFWEYVSGGLLGSGRSQHMMEVGEVTVKRERSATSKLVYSAVDKYSAGIEKVDDTGEVLKGASLKLFTAKNEDGTDDVKELCTTNASSDDSGCYVSNIEAGDSKYGYDTGRYICYSEVTTPAGYVKIPTHCEKIDLSNTTTRYYKINLETDASSSISIADYNTANSYATGDATYKYTINGKDYYNKAESINYYFDGNGDFQLISDSSLIDENNKICITTPMDRALDEVTPDDNCVYYDVMSQNGTAGCYNDTAGFNSQVDFCSGEYRYDASTFTKGNYFGYVGNQLNSVNVSKRDVTGTSEVPGATLAIYKTDGNGECTDTLATSKRFVYSEYVETVTGTDSESGTEDDNTASDNGDSDSDDSSGESVDDTANIEPVDIAATGLTWTSSNTSATIYGLEPGTYCLKETVPASGYKKTETVVKFSMDETGVVNTDAKDNYISDSNTLYLTNELNNMTISKTDIATSKELPGATLQLCTASKDEDGNYVMNTDDYGNCSTANLSSGESLSWVSTDTPYEISGLPAGAYYLVETIAPEGYTTAESVLFIMNEDGTVTDKDGNSLADNKLVMEDMTIEDVKTGQLKMIIVCIVLIVAVLGLLVGYNRYSKSGSSNKKKVNKLSNKVRKRKIHK